MKLTDREWRAFTVEELFSRIVATRGKTTGQLVPGDDVPYIAAAKNNNGCAGVYSSKEHPEWVSKGNCIVFVQLGDGAAGIAHYVPMDFIGMSGKTSCGYIDGVLNCYNGIFISKALSINKELFSHGHSWTGRRLLNSKCMLPVTNDGKPDYEFMEQYVREILLKNKDKYLSFAKKRIAEIGEWKSAGSLTDREWKAFQIGMLFDRIDRGKISSTQGLVHTEKGIPYVGATANNNGVLYCVECDDPKLIQDGNCVAFIRDGQGSVGLSMYRETPCVATVNVSLAYASWVNRYTGIFVSRSSNMIRSKYSFGYKRKDERLKRDFIMLPVTDAGEPDFDFMEQYIKDLMLKKYFQYDAFSERAKSAISETAV